MCGEGVGSVREVCVCVGVWGGCGECEGGVGVCVEV